jgi:ligand-binding SRPBCC domain-containing protein
MRSHVLQARLSLPFERSAVFAFFAAPANLERITPPELRFRIVSRPDRISEGCLIDYRLRLDGFPFRWRTRIRCWQPGIGFVDEQLRGPYRRWIHRHEFEDEPSGGTLVCDFVDFELPFQPIGEAAWPYVRAKLQRIFEYRQNAVAEFFGVRIEEGMSQVSIGS